MNEDLRKWFREKWVNLAKKKKGGGYEECGTSGEKSGYAKCVPAAKAARMSKSEIKSAIRRKRSAQRKAGRPGKDQPGQGNKPIMVKTMKEENITEKNKPTKPHLWARAKSLAKSKFDVYPSAYANAWAAKWYRKKGGGWRTLKEENEMNETIRHEDDKWVIYSKDGSKKLGTYDTEKDAKKRLRQIEYFKHMKEELGRENEWGRPELTKKMMDVTPGQGKDVKQMKTFREFVDVTTETAVIHQELNPVAWEGMNLKPEIRNALLKVADDFVKTWDMNFPITDIILTGSNANYNWTKFSDFDVHVIVNMGETGVTHDLVKALLNAKKNLYNNQRNIKIKGHDVEVYAQDRSEHHIASGQYSLKHDRWLVVPTMQRPNYAYSNIQTKASEIIQQAEDAIAENDLTALQNVLKKIAKMRKSGLERAGEFSDENMAFKVIRNSGMIEKIRHKITQLSDKLLSMNGDTEKIEEAVTPAGRVKKQINIRKNRWKLKKYAKLRPGISASRRRIKRRTELTAVRSLYKNLAGVKNRKNLSSTQKSAIEKIVKARGKPYRKSLSISIQPKLRVSDIKRVTKATKYKA
jgi:hypothetical protein